MRKWLKKKGEEKIKLSGEGDLKDSNMNKTGSHLRLKATNLSHMTTSGLLLPDKKLMEPTVASVWTEKVNNQLYIKGIIICTCTTITVLHRT